MFILIQNILMITVVTKIYYRANYVFPWRHVCLRYVQLILQCAL